MNNLKVAYKRPKSKQKVSADIEAWYRLVKPKWDRLDEIAAEKLYQKLKSTNSIPNANKSLNELSKKPHDV